MSDCPDLQCSICRVLDAKNLWAQRLSSTTSPSWSSSQTLAWGSRCSLEITPKAQIQFCCLNLSPGDAAESKQESRVGCTETKQQPTACQATHGRSIGKTGQLSECHLGARVLQAAHGWMGNNQALSGKLIMAEQVHDCKYKRTEMDKHKCTLKFGLLYNNVSYNLLSKLIFILNYPSA